MGKRLVLLTSSANSLVNFRLDFIKLCIKNGTTVIALAPDYDHNTISILNSVGCETISYKLRRTGINPIIDFYHTLKLITILKSLKADVFFAYFIKPVTYGIIAAYFAGIKIKVGMVEGLGFLFTKDDEYNKLSRKIVRALVLLLYKFSFEKCNRLVVLNKDDANFFLERKICKANQLVILGGIGVNLNEWLYVHPKLDRIRFLYIGRLLKSKGVFDFIEAARIVKRRFPDASFAILGAADNNPDTVDSTYITSAVREQTITWPGHVNVQEWIRESSVFVLPSYYREGVPRSAQEAMASGLPVITTDSPGCVDTVVDGVTGFIVKVKSPSGVAEKMEYFLNNPNKILEMGIQGRRYAETHFDSLKQSKLLYSYVFE